MSDLQWVKVSPTILQSQCGVYTIVKKVALADRRVVFEVYFDSELVKCFEGKGQGRAAREHCADDYADRRVGV